MRIDDPTFAAQNQAAAKRPRLVVRIVFDIATIYVTSHADMVNVPGTPLLGHLKDVQAVSQQINPDEARSTIGSMSFSLVDIESDMTDALRAQLVDELQNLRGRTVELRLGYTDDYDDTKVQFTQQVNGCEYQDGTYRIRCQDVQRETRKEILEPLITTLRLSVTATATTIPVQDTTDFVAVFHGPSYTDAPDQTVYYFRLEDEVIRATGKTADSFTGCTRGVFNTLAVEHEVEAGATADRQPEVTEFIYLELPGPKLAYALLTGVLDGDAATVPDHWHMGVDTSLVNLVQFQTIGPDLYDTTDDDATLVLRFAGLEKTDGKRFLEEQVYQPLGLYSPVLADGRLGLRRMNHILADAPFVMVLDEDSFTQVGALEHDYDSLLNVFSIDWNWDPIAERFTRRRKVIDQGSIDVHGAADVKEFSWQGLHGSRHTDAVLLKRADSIRDRYAGPPLRMSGNLLHRYNVLEVGDVVRVQLEHVRDYTGDAGPIDRSFEIQRIAVDQISGQVSVSLFGSSQRSSVLPPDTGTALPDTWYDDAGTALAAAVTIVGDVIQPGTYNLTGHANLNNAAAIYYHLADLELADGATLTINDNVQLRIRGFFTINGDIEGVGRGKAGAVDDGVFANENPGTPGFIGDTRGWEGLNMHAQLLNAPLVVLPWAAPQANGLYSSFPFIELSVSGAALIGLPTDIRGTSGGSGGRLVEFESAHVADGGDGGDGGAGLAIICRGASLGASGSIDVSGGDSELGDLSFLPPAGDDIQFRAGSGAPGGPGGVLVVVDGSGPSLPDVLAGLTGAYGSIPNAGTQPIGENGPHGSLEWPRDQQPFAGYNTSIGGDISASILRIQRLAPEQTPEEDVLVPAPANLAVETNAAGDAHVLTNTPPPAGVITEYFGSITDDRGDAVLLGASTAGRYVNGADPGEITYYWARNRNIDTRAVSRFAPDTTTTTIIGGALAPPGGDVADPAVTVEIDDGNIVYDAATQPQIENAGINGFAEYTAPVGRNKRVAVSWTAQARISNTTSGTAVGHAELLVRVFIESEEVFRQDLNLEGFIDSNLNFGLLSGSRSFHLAPEETLEVFLTVGRDFSTSGSSPAQTITWRDAMIDLAAVTSEAVIVEDLGEPLLLLIEGSSTTAATSEDGATWDTVGALPAPIEWRHACYSQSRDRILAVALTGTNRFALSDDRGATWSAEADPTTGYRGWSRCIYLDDHDRFVVGRRNGSGESGVVTTDSIVTSDDGGETWVRRTVGSSNNFQTLNLLYFNGILIGTSFLSTPPIVKSTDGGVTWTGPHALNVGGDTIFAGCVHPTLGFVVLIDAAPGSQDCWHSTDGENWTLLTTGPASGPSDVVSHMVYDEVSDLIVGFGSGIHTSPDGVDWTEQEPSSTVAGAPIARSRPLGKTFCLDNSNDLLYGSTDGVNWTTDAIADEGWSVFIAMETPSP